MAYTVGLRAEHGYAAATAVASSLLLFVLGLRVAAARRNAKIPYPYAYAPRTDAEKDPLKNLFNCAQRAHQNTLEAYPTFIVLFTITAIQHPIAASIAGSVYLLGRIFFANGYCTGNPEKRMQGAFGYFGLIALLGYSVKTAVTLSFNL